MKAIKFLAGAMFLLICVFAISQTANTQSETVKVWGNCNMCKSHIEKAAKAAGASYAAWNKDTKILSVKYDPAKTSNMQIQEKVAAAGYDTRDLSADNKAYDQLDDCCKYDRKPAAGKEKVKQIAKNCCDKNEICDKAVCKSASAMECCKNSAVKHNCRKNPANSCCAS